MPIAKQLEDPMFFNSKLTALALAAATIIGAISTPTHAVPVIAYEWTEGGPGNGSNSIHLSAHGVRGPVLADDFISSVSGRVVRVDWWGSSPLGGLPDPDLWEITFHSDAGGAPAATLPGGGISQHFVNTNGSDVDADGVFFFSASWTPQDLLIAATTTYWFSVANGQCTQSGGTTGPGCLAGWNWADAGGAAPTVGSETFTAVNSIGVGPNAGPHFGPWNPVLTAAGGKQDFAFRIWVEVPEPETLAIFVFGLAGLGFMRRRRKLN